MPFLFMFLTQDQMSKEYAFQEWGGIERRKKSKGPQTKHGWSPVLEPSVTAEISRVS